MAASPDTPAETKQSGFAKLFSKLPAGAQRNLKDIRKWKNWFRSMVVIFVCMIYLVVQRTLEVLGQAAFFSLIVAVMLPPSMPMTTFIFAILTIVVGMCLGWAWGVAAMAAALRARSQTVLAASYMRASGLISSTPDANSQRFVFEGVFLDVRSTVVFGVFFAIGIAFLSWTRAKAPKLTLGTIFGSIVLIVFCSYGPLFPSAQYTLATQFLIPTGFYVATALASIILIFPQTLNHMVTDGYVKGFLRPGNSLIELQAKVLATDPSDVAAWSELTSQANQLRTAAAETLVALQGQIGLLEMEVSRGRLGAKDLKALIVKSRGLLGRMLGLVSFQIIVTKQNQQNHDPTHSDSKSTSGPSEEKHSDHHDHLRRQRYEEFMSQKETERGHSLADLLPILNSSSLRLREACTKGLGDFTDFVDFSNTHRWSKKYPEGEKSAADGLEKRRANLNALRDALTAYRKEDHLEVLQKFKGLFDEETGDYNPNHPSLHAMEKHRPSLSMRQLYTCFVFSTGLTSYATALVDFLQVALEMEANSPKNRTQWPTALMKLGHVALSKDEDGNTNPVELGSDVSNSDQPGVIASRSSSRSADSEDGSIEKEHAKAKKRDERQAKKDHLYRPDLDALPPRNGLQKFARILSRISGGFTSPEGLFALKAALVSVALWIPSVVENSAWFAYSNRSIWAQIMAVTGLAVFSGDLVLGFLVRFTGTLIGLVLGMLAWYVGNGNGSNPYGTIASTMVFIAPLVFWRTTASQQQMAFPLMIGVTLALIVGYSWLDSHLPVLSNSGIGVDVAWKRALLVIIGFAAAFIISLFPKPMSARKIVRLRAAKIIESLSELYVDEAKGFLLEAQDKTNTIHEDDLEERAGLYRARFLGVVGKLSAVNPQLVSAAFEPNLRGPWPKKRYHELFDILKEILAELALLGNAWTRTSPRNAAHVTETPFFDPTLVADILALFSLLSSSLRDGRPMPVFIPLAERVAGLSLHASQDGLSLYSVKLNWKNLQSEQTTVYATTIVALNGLTHSLDRLHDCIRQLVGTKTFDLFDEHVEARAKRDLDMFGQA